MLKRVLRTFLTIYFVLVFTNNQKVSADFELKAISPHQNERLVISSLLQLYKAQIIYKENFHIYNNFGSLEELYKRDLIDDVLVTGSKYGYNYTVETTARTYALPAEFVIHAVPRVYRKTGKRSFRINDRCILRAAKNNGAEIDDDEAILINCPDLHINIEANERGAIQALRTIAEVQEIYIKTVGNGSYGTLTTLLNAGLIDSVLGSRASHYYNFLITPIAASGSYPARFRSRALPIAYRRVGIRSFYIDETSVLRGADKRGGNADRNDPVIKD